MRKSKLISLLQALDAEELKLFVRYIDSPYFNTNKNVRILLAFLRKYYPSFDQTTFTKEKVYKAIYGKKKYNEQQLSNIMSELSKLLMDFIMQQQLAERPTYCDYLTLEGLQSRNLEPQFIRKWKTTKQDLDKLGFRDVDYYYNTYLLEEIAYRFNVAGQGRVTEANLSEVIYNFEYYYLSNKLKYCCVLLNRQQIILEETGESFLLDELLDLVERRSFDHVPVIMIWYRLLLLLRNEDDIEYTHLKKLLDEQGHCLPKDEIRQVYAAVYNFCNKQYKRGKESYLREIFEVLQNMLNREIIIVGEYITPHLHFRNIVMVALRLEEVSWAEQFIQDYALKVHPNYRDSTVAYCKAALYFQKRDYNKVIEHLSEFELKDFYHYMEHKLLLIKTYYELEEYNSLESMLEQMRIYVIRAENMPDHYRLAYNNFIKMIQRLLRFFGKGKKEELKATILHTEALMEKDWLLKKAAEL